MAYAAGVVIIIIVILVWGVAGGTNPATGSNGGPPAGSGCANCTGLKTWWDGLRPAQKVREAVYYAWKRADCWARGCPI